MAAKWWPNTTQRLVGMKSRPLLRRSAGVARVVVEHQHLGGDPRRVEAVGQGIDAQRGGDEPQCVDRFAAVQRDAADGCRAEHGDAKP